MESDQLLGDLVLEKELVLEEDRRISGINSADIVFTYFPILDILLDSVVTRRDREAFGRRSEPPLGIQGWGWGGRT